VTLVGLPITVSVMLPVAAGAVCAAPPLGAGAWVGAAGAEQAARTPTPATDPT